MHETSQTGRRCRSCQSGPFSIVHPVSYAGCRSIGRYQLPGQGGGRTSAFTATLQLKTVGESGRESARSPTSLNRAASYCLSCCSSMHRIPLPTRSVPEAILSVAGWNIGLDIPPKMSVAGWNIGLDMPPKMSKKSSRGSCHKSTRMRHSVVAFL